ncbi:hypothetical protein B0O99DRAFT_623727 [Bisporella sp. PMI_857]|nr:hypothetical protein B0O99DRAFT_623727 [Bisporella sp. PMI_857]
MSIEMERPIPYETIQQWKHEVQEAKDPFIAGVPKIELHVHIEGTLFPELRWKLAQRNGITLHSNRLNKDFHSLEELKEAYNLLEPRSIKGANQVSAFFEAYYGGMEVLRKEEDFYELAREYFARISEMNVRYVEVFFDPQAHTRRGVALGVVMGGLRKASIEAEKEFNVKSQWIMCMLRDLPPEEALATYEAALPYRDMIVAIGLDGNEYNRPPALFEELFVRARNDGFRVTCHCDVTQKDTHEHIRQVAESVAKTGADRIDHGLDAAELPELVNLIKKREIGMTLCPWAYVRHHTEPNLFSHIRTLFNAGIKINISSDGPALMEGNWVIHNLLLTRQKCGFTNGEIAKVERDSVEMCWADAETKRRLIGEIDGFCASFVSAVVK